MSAITANRLRICGSLALCAAYLLITSGFLVRGVLLNAVAQFALAPYLIKHKAWDLLAVSSFFLAADLQILFRTW